MATKATIDQLASWLKEKDDIALIGHVFPDGDTTGSCLAIWHALRAMGKRAVVCLPGGIANMYKGLPGADEVICCGEDMPFEPKTAFAVDVSEMPRMGEAGVKLFKSCENRAVLDHHSTNTGFGELFVLDGEAAAAGEMVVALIRALGVELTRDMAACLFVAISTDCGNFNYSNTRPETFIAAADCVEAGADVEKITRRLYRTRTKGRTHLLGLVLAGLEVSEDGKMAWARLTKDMLKQANALREDNEGIVNYLLEIEGVIFACLAEEREENVTKFSLRSVAPLDVAGNVAVPLGGGGHDRAAGCTLNMGMEAALEKVLATARKALENI